MKDEKVKKRLNVKRRRTRRLRRDEKAKEG
jgi:hypothetical protein